MQNSRLVNDYEGGGLSGNHKHLVLAAEGHTEVTENLGRYASSQE